MWLICWMCFLMNLRTSSMTWSMVQTRRGISLTRHIGRAKPYRLHISSRRSEKYGQSSEGKGEMLSFLFLFFIKGNWFMFIHDWSYSCVRTSITVRPYMTRPSFVEQVGKYCMTKVSMNMSDFSLRSCYVSLSNLRTMSCVSTSASEYDFSTSLNSLPFSSITLPSTSQSKVTCR